MRTMKRYIVTLKGHDYFIGSYGIKTWSYSNRKDAVRRIALVKADCLLHTGQDLEDVDRSIHAWDGFLRKPFYYSLVKSL